MNVAARMGSWSARHRTKAIGGWLLFVVAAVAIGSALGTKQLSNAQGSNGDAAKAETILASAGFNDSGIGERAPANEERPAGHRGLARGQR